MRCHFARLCGLPAVLLLLLAVQPVLAQQLQSPPSSSLLSAQPSSGAVGSPGGTLLSPNVFPPPPGPMFPAAPYGTPMVPAGQGALSLSARFGPDAPAIAFTMTGSFSSCAFR